MVTVVCVAAGCDYLKNLPMVGLIKARQYVVEAFKYYVSGENQTPTNRKSKSKNAEIPLPPLRRLFDILKGYKHMKYLTPKGVEKYELNFLRSLVLFRHPVVYDPRQGGQAVVGPNNDPELLCYKPYAELIASPTAIDLICGERLPAGVAKAVAQGYVSPRDFEFYLDPNAGGVPPTLVSAVIEFKRVLMTSEGGDGSKSEMSQFLERQQKYRFEREAEQEAVELEEEECKLVAAVEREELAFRKEKDAKSAAKQKQIIKDKRKEETKNEKEEKSLLDEPKKKKKFADDNRTAAIKKEFVGKSVMLLWLLLLFWLLFCCSC